MNLGTSAKRFHPKDEGEATKQTAPIIQGRGSDQLASLAATQPGEVEVDYDSQAQGKWP